MNKNIILVDSNSFLTRLAYGLHAYEPELMNKRDFKHVTLEMIAEICNSFETNRIIMCMDGTRDRYWRKEIFPYYKENRKHIKIKDGDLDYPKFAKEVIHPVLEDITENLPLNYLRLDHTEADDIISTLVLLFDKHKVYDNIIIWSGDSDFDQLKEYCDTNIIRVMFNNNDLKIQHSEMPLIEKIIRGDAGDGIPNSYTYDSFFIDRINGKEVGRQKSVRKKMLEEITNTEHNNLDDLIDDYDLEYIKRNQQLIDFRFIPDEIKRDIIDEYQRGITKEYTRERIFEYISMRHEINPKLYQKLYELFL